ncbi:MAG: DUF4031 domain-containing protein [Acidimicrobiales bacterium]|nr:DUF4031 domain-containing protein [Acidimicrobiales bacterium]
MLVDEAVWPWRGARWAHLVSDESVAELHAFARRLRLRRMAFQGDHYDVTEEQREQALILGADGVRGRDLVRRLRAAGLRLAAVDRPGTWEEVGRWSSPGVRPALPDVTIFGPLVGALSGVDACWQTAEVVAFRRTKEMALVVQDVGGVVLERMVPVGIDVWCHDDRMIELLMPLLETTE